jgi:hypothetical protein
LILFLFVSAGLDSDTALAVVKLLRAMTKSEKQFSSPGRTILATIHQPTYQIFKEFDYLILLAGGGLIYCGPTEGALNYFQSQFGLSCPLNCNPPEFFLDLLSAGSIDKFLSHPQVNDHDQLINTDYSTRLNYFINYWRAYRRKLPKIAIPRPERAKQQFQTLLEERNSSFLKSIQKKQNEEKNSPVENIQQRESPLSAPAVNILNQNQNRLPSLSLPVDAFLSNILNEVSILFSRSQLCSARSPLVRLFQLLQSLGLAFLIGATFFSVPNTRAGIQNRLGVIFFLLIAVLFSNLFSSILSFTEERAVFLREQANGMYGVWSYFIARTGGEIGPTITFNGIFSALVYLLIGLSRDSFSQFCFFVVYLQLFAFAGQSLGLLVSASIESRLTALIVAPIAIAPFILFTPYSLPEALNIPFYFLPLKWISPFWWAFSGLAQNEFSSLELSCKEAEKVDVGKLIGLGELQLQPICIYTRGKQILSRFSIESQNENEIWKNLAILTALCVAFRVLAGFQLRSTANKVRRPD